MNEVNRHNIPRLLASLASLASVLLVLMPLSVATAKDGATKVLEVKDEAPAYRKVDLADYIEVNSPKNNDKGKIILPVKPVAFTAKLMSEPRKGTFSYIKGALKMMHVEPLPDIDYQLFLKAKNGKVIAVYAENEFAENLEKQIRLGLLKIGESLFFKGYHSYNYKRGPAMVMKGVFDERSDKLEVATVEVEAKVEAKVEVEVDAVKKVKQVVGEKTSVAANSDDGHIAPPLPIQKRAESNLDNGEVVPVNTTQEVETSSR